MDSVERILSSTPSPEAVPGVYELLPDLHFKRGFEVQNMGGSEKESTAVANLTYSDPALTPVWKIAQWETRYDFRDPSQTVFQCLMPGVYRYDSRDKVLTADTSSGKLGMELRASQVYEAPRRPGQGWPHLLIECRTVNADAPFASDLKNAKHLRLTFSQRLIHFRDHMGDAADFTLHAGSFYIYLYIKGTNAKAETEMTWFGLTLFDNRFQFDEEKGSQDTGKADASGLFIYQLPIRAFRDTEVALDQWIHVDIDVMPFVKRALILAQERGYMLGVTMDTVRIDGMNMGWEMPGTYDGHMEIRNLSLRAYVHTGYDQPDGVANILMGRKAQKTIVVDEQCTLTVPDFPDDSGNILTLRCERKGNAYALRAWRNGEEFEDAFEKPILAGNTTVEKPGIFRLGE